MAPLRREDEHKLGAYQYRKPEKKRVMREKRKQWQLEVHLNLENAHSPSSLREPDYLSTSPSCSNSHHSPVHFLSSNTRLFSRCVSFNVNAKWAHISIEARKKYIEMINTLQRKRE